MAAAAAGKDRSICVFEWLGVSDFNSDDDDVLEINGITVEVGGAALEPEFRCELLRSLRRNLARRFWNHTCGMGPF